MGFSSHRRQEETTADSGGDVGVQLCNYKQKCKACRYYFRPHHAGEELCPACKGKGLMKGQVDGDEFYDPEEEVVVSSAIGGRGANHGERLTR